MKITKEMKIGLVATLGLVILFFGLKFLKGLSLFDSDDTYYITFTEIGGLPKSTPVYADGYQVGVIKEINYDYSLEAPIKASIGVSKKMHIPEGTRAEIVKDLMGNMQVDLLLGPDHSKLIPVGGTIPGRVQGSALSEAAAFIPEIQKMLPKLDSILTGVNNLVNDPALGASVHNLKTTTAEFAVTSKKIHLMADELQGKLPDMLAQADGTLRNTNRLTGKLAGVDVQGTMSRVNATIDNVHQLTAQLHDRMNSRDNSLGLLMNDRSLYDNLNGSIGSLHQTIGHADSLVTDLKAHPKRYVHFSLFGKKDK